MDYNSSLIIGKALSEVAYVIDEEDARYVDVTSLYQVLQAKNVSLLPPYFKRFVALCGTMPCTSDQFPVRDEEDVSKVTENIRLRNQATKPSAKMLLADKMIEDAMPNLDMYCYEVSFDRAKDIIDYCFNGHYISFAMYSMIMDELEKTDNDPCMLYMSCPYPLDGHPKEPTVGRLSSKYNRSINLVEARFRRGNVVDTHIVKLSVDCYISFFPITMLGQCVTL